MLLYFPKLRDKGLEIAEFDKGLEIAKLQHIFIYIKRQLPVIKRLNDGWKGAEKRE